MKFKGFENIVVIVFIFILLISGMFGVNYFNSKGVFDSDVLYVNNLKSPYSVLISIDNLVSRELDFDVEVIYKKDKLVVGAQDVKCSNSCEAKIEINRVFFDEYEVVIRTDYNGRLYEKKLDFIFDRPPATFSIHTNKNYVWKVGNDVKVNGVLTSIDNSKRDYIFDVFPTKTPLLKTTFQKSCVGTCDFNFSLKSEILFGEYTINVYSNIDVVRSTFNVLTEKQNEDLLENETKTGLPNPQKYVRPKLEKYSERTELQDRFALTGQSVWDGEWNEVKTKVDSLDPIFKKNRLGEIKEIVKKNDSKYDLKLDLGGNEVDFSDIDVDEIENFSIHYDPTFATDVVYFNVSDGSFNSSKITLRKDGGFLESINVCNEFISIEEYNLKLNLSEEEPLTEDTLGYLEVLCESGWAPSNYSFEQNETHVWFNVTHFSAYSGSLFIFNPQSYPVVGGLWSVEFNTTQSSDLWMSASNGTTWSRDGVGTDLQFMNLRCGNEIVDYEWVNGSVYVSNYSCDSNTYETSRVLTGGVHTKQFIYGVDTGYAKNFATDRGSGFMAYIEGTVQTPRYRVYDPDTNSWSTELSALSVGQSIEELQVACSVARFECALLTVDFGDDVQIQFWDGSCWDDGTTCGQTYTLETITNNEVGQRANLMYERVSGDLLVVWGTTTADDIEYRVWNGSSWSAEGAVQTDLGGSLLTAGNSEWFELAQDPLSDDIGMIYRTSSNEAGVVIYDGDSNDFSCELTTPFTGLTAALRPNVDIAYEQVSRDLFAVGGLSSTTEFNYVTKAAGGCTYSGITQTTTSNYGEQSDQIRIAPVWDDDIILIGIKADLGNDMDIGAWSGSSELANGAGDIVTEPEANGNRQLDVACPKDGTDRCVAPYADSNDASVSYYTYIPSTNTWTKGTDYDGATAMSAAGRDVIECTPFPFSTDYEIMCIFSDDADDLFAKVYDAQSNSWYDTEGGSSLETEGLPAEYKSFSFNWVIFDAPFKPIALDPLNGSSGNLLDLNLTAYVEDPNSDIMDVSFFWGNGTQIPLPIPSDWDDVSQPYRQQIDFTGASSDIDSYTIQFEINFSVLSPNFDFSNDRDSLRFYYDNTTSGGRDLISHNVISWDSGGESAGIMLKIPLIDLVDDATIYMYYGNNSKPNVEDYCSVYFFCDQFDDGSISGSLTTTDQDTVGGTSFSEGSGVLSITAGGDDTWTGVDEYGSVFLDGYSGDFDVRVAIMSYTSPNVLAKGGIMFKNDMTAAGSSTGYVFNVLTPGNGYSWQRDINNNGFLDASATANTASVPSYVRIVKSGTLFAGYYSKTTPDTWTSQGSETITSTNTVQDIGLSYTSHAGTTLGTTTYDNFTVQRYTTDTISTSFGASEGKNSYSSGSNATAFVSGLSVFSNYTWYVEASDSMYTSRSDLFHFRTKSLVPPFGNLISPSNGTTFSAANVTFSANASDLEDGLDYAILYVWNSVDESLFLQETIDLEEGSFNEIFNITKNIPAGNYLWNYEAVDLGENRAFLGAENRSFNITVPSVIVEYFDFMDPFYIRQNTSRMLSVNISCTTQDCLDINSTLYYSSPLTPVSDLENFESGTFTDWNPESADACTWILDQGGTPSGLTGPDSDNTVGKASGWYIYVETSGSGTTPPYYCDGTDSVAIINSSVFNAGEFATNISFWYHMYGATMGTLHLDVYNGGSWDNSVWSLSGEQQTDDKDPYVNVAVDLSSYSGSTAIRFRYIWGGGFTGDIALDDITITTQDIRYIPIETFSTTPLWTNSSNPNIFSLNAGENQIVNYYINATGIIGLTYTSYVEGFMNSVSGYNDNGSIFDISIVDTAPPVGYKLTPANNTLTENTTVNFSSSVTSAFGLDEARLYIWNEIGSLLTSPISYFSGEYSTDVSWNYTFPSNGNYTWNVLFTDIYGDSSWADNNSNFTITKATRVANINTSIITPGNISYYPVRVNTTFNLSVVITCDTVLETNCGNIDAYVQYNNSNSTFSNMLTSSSVPFWSVSFQPQSCYLLDGQNCTLSWDINATGEIESFNLIRVLATSNNSYAQNSTSENLTVQIGDRDTVVFLVSSLNIGETIESRGIIDRATTVRSFIGNNTGITVICISGNCSQITDDWSDGISLNEGATQDVTFTCSDTVSGILEATFELDSNEDNSPTNIVVSCIVTPEPGVLSVSITSPSLSEIYNVSHDKIFDLNATISCIDNCGDVSAYVIYPMNEIFWNVNWDYKRELSIDVTTAVSAGYQILVHLNASVLGSNFNWTNNCDDIRFVNGTVILDYWIESCDTFSEEIYVWIETDVALSSSSTYTIDLFYGNNLAISNSDPSRVFRQDEVFLVTGDCAGSGNCDMDNNSEANTLRANIGGAGMAIHGSGYVNGIDDIDNPFGVNDNYYTRYRLLWIPTVTDSYSFGSYNDDDMEISIMPYDSYGSGITGYNDFGANDAVTTQYGNWHNNNACGNNVAVEGTRALNADQGYWIDYVSIEGAGGEDQQMCVDSGSGYNTFDSSNFGGEFYARSYIEGSEPVLSVVGSEIELDSVSTVFGADPFWIELNQPQGCSLLFTGSCQANWKVNASDLLWNIYNLSVIVSSDVEEVYTNISEILQVRIVNLNPEINLIYPFGKIVSNGTIEFSWNVTDFDDSIFDCRVFVDSNLFSTNTCYYGENNLNLTISSFGYHNWSVNATDYYNGSNVSSVFNFTLIKDQNLKISKLIQSVGTNLYSGNYTIENQIVSNQNATILTFLDNDYNINSFSPVSDFNYLTYINPYLGDIYGSNISLPTLIFTEKVNFSANAISDFELRNFFVFGLD